MKLTNKWQHRLTRLVEVLIIFVGLVAAFILWRWFRDGGGLEAVYVAIGVLLAALFTARRWLQAAAKPAASQHAGWGASSQGHNEMSSLRQQMAQSLSLDDLRSLTFDLNLNFDNLAGETLERKIISLLESCRRQNLLPPLLAQLQAQRPHIAWAQVSALPTATTPQAQRNRENLLNNVQTAWIDGFLKQSLHSEVIKLSLSYRPEAVGQRPWQLILKQTGQPDAPVSPDETLLDIFTAAGRNLLILGEPGSGKTITLLQLAEALIDLARQDPAEPLPIILNLSSWAREQPPLGDWLVEEMFVQYGVARDLTRAGIAQNQFLYLLDGLDEVAAEARDACVTALNEFKAAFPAELVVCSRTAEYAALQEQLHLGAAIQIKPLTDAQIEAYLDREGAELAAVRTTLAHDAELRELAQSPLMLSLMTLAYRGETAIDLRPDAGKETRRQHLFAHYVQKMFERRPLPPDSPYTQEQALGWLATIARGMKEHDQSVFYIERLQPTWLGNGRWQTYYYKINLVIAGAIGGLGVGTFLGVLGASRGVYFGLLGLIVGFLTGLIAFRFEEEIHFREMFVWQKINMNRFAQIFLSVFAYLMLASLVRGFSGEFNLSLHTTLLIGLATGFVSGIVFWYLGKVINLFDWLLIKIFKSPSLPRNVWIKFGLYMGLLFGLQGYFQKFNIVGALIFGIVWGLVFGIFGGLLVSVQKQESENSSFPNQTVQNAIRNTFFLVFVFIVLGLTCSWILFKIEGCIGQFICYRPYFIFNGSVLGIIFIGILSILPYAMLLASYLGIYSIIQHFTLRWLLAKVGKLPYPFHDKKLVTYLNAMHSHILLRQVGGGWIFLHRSLLEYFTSLPTSTTSN